MASEVECAAMRQAIILSALGLGTTSPNPPVGCIILDRQGHIVGTGFHRRKGEAHAEVNALGAAGSAARGGTAVVTLEPCNHVGVTPACRQALIDAGIARVVIGVMDPTSRGDGGAAVLAAMGIDVETGVLAAEVMSVLGPWLLATTRKTPHLTLAYVVEAEDERGEALLDQLRSSADIVVTDDRIEEGVAGGHSTRHLDLRDLQPPRQHLATWLADAQKAGVRTVLLCGQGRAAEALLSLHAVDRLVLAVPRSSEGLGFAPSISAAWPTFEISELSSWSHGLLVKLDRISATA
ncbi:bifunctional diaminohydroxyphosphoribosylaminopyrimidine deaminase/5-amino-6-(5-phosphoribosylamino)uracil reductase RibD [Actinoplanes sp. NPDC051343]|uniref:bifunctional diaminohydroxyphosphoribosylaminopyrimidine deaminase/5-amino-6-(5-phosphoribosylamino)uracil reductase RibD n=1 Tax=Actinoplanes sp. NPDC051343 TaxID=3363906 RepID=UPI00379A83FF